MNLSDPIGSLYLVGPTYAKRLEKLNIFTIEDLLYHFPFRYDDLSLISPIARVQAGETLTVTGTIEQIENSYTKNNKKIQKATIKDNSGTISAIWFNQPFLVKTIKIGENYNFSGKCDWFGQQKVLISPEYESIKYQVLSIKYQKEINNNIHTGRLVPVYPETAGVSSKWLRSRIKVALELFTNTNQIEEFLPEEILKKQNLPGEFEAIKEIHFPRNFSSAAIARQRLAFDELFLLQLTSLLRKKQWQKKVLTQKFSVDQEKVALFIKKLPFKLTEAQIRCTKQILDDLCKDIPMNRLLEGDVGSGKTVVAAIVAYAAFLNGQSTLCMAPTEILANQHYLTFKALFDPLEIPVGIITASHKSANSKQQNAISGKQSASIIIGTHALLFQDFGSEKIGLVVVDEQHRFGVEQRMALSQKGVCPHFLTMTATPIPRTIALTVFGDLDLSVLDEMPEGRIPVKTWVVPKEKRAKGYEWIRSRIKDTPQQAFVVCPLIEQSESLADVKAVTNEFEVLSKKIFPDLKLGLLHGRIKPKEKNQILVDFKEGKLDILVATPVVEVGIDIPNASIMLIEAAERFGLAQLHQLRGRIGRSDKQSFCFLFTENEDPNITKRLKYMEKTNIGMELADLDLKLRGPGEIFGTRQHGFPDLKVASFSDLNLIEATRITANQILAAQHLNPPLKKRLEKYKIDTVAN